jgi:hypothetical protein
MNRSVASLLFLAVAVFFAGCSSHPDSYGETSASGSSGSSGSTSSTGSTGSTDSSATPVSSETDDLATFARAGIADPEYADARIVNDINFVSDENPDAFNDVF